MSFNALTLDNGSWRLKTMQTMWCYKECQQIGGKDEEDDWLTISRIPTTNVPIKSKPNSSHRLRVISY